MASTTITNVFLNLPSSNQQLLNVLTPPVLDETDLFYYGGGGTFFSTVQSDFVQGGGWTHHGNPPIVESELAFSDNSSAPFSVSTLEVVSNSNQKGIVSPLLGDYYWDEVYTTPIGLFDVLTFGTSIGLLDPAFELSGIATNSIAIKIEDLHIIPKVGDKLFVQRYWPLDTPLALNSSTTDELNHLPIYRHGEAFILTLTSVDLDTTANTGVIGNTFILAFDKNFEFIENEQYTVVLLNRFNLESNEGLKLNTFRLIEIHQQQLLGDQYDNQLNTAIPFGKINHLNYSTGVYLGTSTLLRPLLPDSTSPYAILSIDDDIKDSIATEVGSVNIHFPHIMLQDVIPATLPLILSNSSSSILTDTTGVGQYAPLLFEGKTYGFVAFDLRIIIITDSELVTAIGYNSNRNFTLPPLVGNQNNRTIHPVSTEPLFRFFATYRIKSIHYDYTLPYSQVMKFNWFDGTANQIDNTLTTATLEVSFENLKHLFDTSVDYGFQAEEWELIIGEYEFDYDNNIIGVQNVVIMDPVQLKTLGVQNTSHTTTVTYGQYQFQVASLVNYDLTTLYDDEQLLVGNNDWFVGIVEYKAAIKQYRLTITPTIKADKWNGSTNPTFVVGDEFQKQKLITEIAFTVEGETGNEILPFIYGKISPPIEKNNLSDLILELNVDF